MSQQQLSFFAPQSLPPATDLSADFEAFWQAVPRHPNSPKNLAFVSYRRAREIGATAKEIMDGAQRYRWSDDPYWRPHVSTWLNQRRWECEDLSADPYGMKAFLAKQPTGKDIATPWSITYHADGEDLGNLQLILAQAGFEPEWRGPLDIVATWVNEGFDPASIWQVIGREVERNGRRKTIAAYDGLVREKAARLIPERAKLCD